jgi:NHL repeat
VTAGTENPTDCAIAETASRSRRPQIGLRSRRSRSNAWLLGAVANPSRLYSPPPSGSGRRLGPQSAPRSPCLGSSSNAKCTGAGDREGAGREQAEIADLLPWAHAKSGRSKTRPENPVCRHRGRCWRGSDAAAGRGPGQFIAPHGIAVDSSGDIYVAEVANTYCRGCQQEARPRVALAAETGAGELTPARRQERLYQIAKRREPFLEAWGNPFSG